MMKFFIGMFVGAAIVYVFYPLIKNSLNKLFRQND